MHSFHLTTAMVLRSNLFHFLLFNNFRGVSIVDTMLKKLESYANNLEEIVDQRTGELIDEKKKTDLLLFKMLPK